MENGNFSHNLPRGTTEDWRRSLPTEESENQRSLESSFDRSVLNGYQFSRLLLFEGPQELRGKPRLKEFGAVQGFISTEEQAVLKRVSKGFMPRRSAESGKSYGMEYYPPFRSLKDISAFIRSTYFNVNGDADRAADILKRLDSHINLKIIEFNDVYKQDGSINEKQFKELPLLAQYAFTKFKFGMSESVYDFLNKDKGQGVLVFTECRKPTPEYLEAIDDISENLPLAVKINIALSEKITGELAEVSHGFASFIALSPEPITNGRALSTEIITQNLNKRMDNVEREVAQIRLQEIMHTSEAKSAKVGMAISALMAVPLFFIGHSDNVLLDTLVKFIPPTFADGVSLYAQQNPWLPGDTFRQKFIPFIERLKTTHKPAVITSLIATSLGSIGAETIPDPSLAAFTYAAVPFALAMLFSAQTYNVLKKELRKDPLDTIKYMYKHNPTHASIDKAAFITFLTGLTVFGGMGQLNNGAAVALIEGGEEHAVASLLTASKTSSSRRKFEDNCNKEIDKMLNLEKQLNF